MKRIPGEYLRVSQWSGQKELLRLYHSLPCNILEAKEIVEFCNKKFPVGKINLVFREGITGETYYASKTIYLPTEPLPPWVRFNPFRFLRVGLILHEFTHLWQDSTKKRSPRHHDKFFTGLFDRVMVEYSQKSL